MGFRMMLGIEPEFFLLKKDEGGKIVPVSERDILEKPCYDLKGLLDSYSFVDEVVTATNTLGWAVHSFDHEDANGQFEIDFMCTDAVTMADRVTFLRSMMDELARTRGWMASFMQKPFRDRTGSGAHFNMSLADPKTGANVFETTNDPRGCGISQLGYQFVASILRHAPAICSVIAPTVKSYKRLVRRGSMSGYPCH